MFIYKFWTSNKAKRRPRFSGVLVNIISEILRTGMINGFYVHLYLHCAKLLLMTSRARGGLTYARPLVARSRNVRLSTLRSVLGLHCMHCSRREKNFVVARKLLRDQFWGSMRCKLHIRPLFSFFYKGKYVQNSAKNAEKNYSTEPSVGLFALSSSVP